MAGLRPASQPASLYQKLSKYNNNMIFRIKKVTTLSENVMDGLRLYQKWSEYNYKMIFIIQKLTIEQLSNTL